VIRSRNWLLLHVAVDKERGNDAPAVQRVVSLHRQFRAQHFGGILAEPLGQDRFRGFSAGSFPKGSIHPFALKLLRALDLPAEDLRSKSWNEFAKRGAPVMDFVFTVCDQAAGEVCPIWPGQPITAHWGMPDPAAVDGSEVAQSQAFHETFRALENRIKIFAALPIASLDRMSLARQVEAIGRIRPDAAEDHAS
jgi:arsenate reductase (thioredoxin)